MSERGLQLRRAAAAHIEQEHVLPKSRHSTSRVRGT